MFLRGDLQRDAGRNSLWKRCRNSKALQTICDRRRIRRIARGLYDNPQTHPKLGILEPSAEQIVRAICSKEHTRVQPSGAYAANQLGLSTQVPAKLVFLTDGPSKRIIVGNRSIELKNRDPSTMAGAGKLIGLFIQCVSNCRWIACAGPLCSEGHTLVYPVVSAREQPSHSLLSQESSIRTCNNSIRAT